ncbi:hypothetical protein KY290_000598 [Solanum tuberosum]|uniref:MULE transposase domain-containing protein n=1 Tax=Solanum tuberosum TaxID=4113 RepID=A0ABQ7WJT8_SOLTU|nr:hypothetical protein KY290_000598 [Solanum tuberosum]
MKLRYKSGLQFTLIYEGGDLDMYTIKLHYKGRWVFEPLIDYGDPVLHDEEGLVDMDEIEKNDESDSTTEECESFHDSDYSLEEADMNFDKSINSTVDDTQEDEFATSYEELVSLHGDSDEENRKRSIVFNPTRDLEDSKFKFALHMSHSNSKEFKWAVEVHAMIQKKDIRFKKNESTRSRATWTKEEQFEMLWDYCAELRRSNPGTTSGCRPIIGIDGCHLKGNQQGWQLLTAVGIDGNDNMYPIAFAIMEGELKKIWSWFLTLLDEDLGISRNPFAWTFISDKQKGLIPTFDDTMQHVAHKFCVRHLHNNFKTEGFGGQALKDVLWKTARATTKAEFFKHMEEMGKLDSKAPEWFTDQGLFSLHFQTIWVEKDEPEMYVHECYAVEHYMKSYNPSILPIVSFDQWPKIGIEPPLPPYIRHNQIDQLNQTRVPQEQLRSSAFISEEIGEHSREGISPLIIEKMGKQHIPVSKLQEALSQNNKRVRSDSRAQKKIVP